VGSDDPQALITGILQESEEASRIPTATQTRSSCEVDLRCQSITRMQGRNALL